MYVLDIAHGLLSFQQLIPLPHVQDIAGKYIFFLPLIAFTLFYYMTIVPQWLTIPGTQEEDGICFV